MVRKTPKFLAMLLAVSAAVSSLTLGSAMAADTTDTQLRGQVTAISGSSITLALYEDTAGEAPTGEAPTGEAPDTDSTPPELPTTDDSAADGTQPTERGNGGGGHSMTLSGETQTITISDDTTITTDEQGESTSATLSDITVGCTLFVTLSDDDTVSAVSIMQAMAEGDAAANGGNGGTATDKSTAGSTAKSAAATLSQSAVTIDGTAVSFQAYNINGNNYFKLRDLAKALTTSDKTFEVGYDSATAAITLTSGKAYTTVGGELAAAAGTASATASTSAAAIYLDGTQLNLTAYNIGGNNYFKLRDLAEALDFGVSYDSTSNTIVIDTTAGYSVA